MLDGIFGFIDPVVARIDARLNEWGLRPGQRIALAVAFGIVAAVVIALHAYWVGLGFFVLSTLAVTLGSARRRPVSPFDMIVYAALAFGFAIADPSRALAASFLLLGMIVLAACTIAFAPRHSSRGAVAATGLMIFLAIASACIRPDWFSLMAYAAGLACFPAAGLIAASSIVRVS